MVLKGGRLEAYPKAIEDSIEILEDNLKQISSVLDWAQFMGYSRSYFSTSFTECFGEPPSKCLYRVRYRKLHKIVLKHPHETSRAVAIRLGLRDEQALYKFLNRHYSTNFTAIRKKLLYGKK